MMSSAPTIDAPTDPPTRPATTKAHARKVLAGLAEPWVIIGEASGADFVHLTIHPRRGHPGPAGVVADPSGARRESRS